MPRAIWMVCGAFVLALTMWFYVDNVLIPRQVADAAVTGEPRGNLSDLFPRWWGAHELLLHGRDPYSQAVTREIQAVHYGRALDPVREASKDQQAFAYPIYVAFLLAPTLGLPFEVVQAGFAALLLALTAASVPLWMRAIGWRPGLAVTATAIFLALGSYPTVQGFSLQQLSLLVGALLAATGALLVAGWQVPAGILLALATIKPQIALPLVAWLGLWTFGDWPRRQRLAWSFAATMALLLAGAEIASPGWIGRFRAALADYQAYTGGRSLVDTLLTPAGGAVATGLLLVGLTVLGWRLRRAPAGSPGFAIALAAVPAVTLLIIPSWAPYNQLLLLPGLLLLAQQGSRLWARGRAARYLYLAVWLLVGWPLAATLGLTIATAVLPATTVQAGWTLPLWTSLFIPLGVLAALTVLPGAMPRTAPIEAPA